MAYTMEQIRKANRVQAAQRRAIFRMQVYLSVRQYVQSLGEGRSASFLCGKHSNKAVKLLVRAIPDLRSLKDGDNHRAIAFFDLAYVKPRLTEKGLLMFKQGVPYAKAREF